MAWKDGHSRGLTPSFPQRHRKKQLNPNSFKLRGQIKPAPLAFFLSGTLSETRKVPNNLESEKTIFGEHWADIIQMCILVRESGIIWEENYMVRRSFQRIGASFLFLYNDLYHYSA